MTDTTEHIVAPIFSKPTQVVISVEKPTTEQAIETKTETSKEQPEEINPASLIPQEPYLTSPLFYEVANYFGIEQRDYDDAKYKLAEVVEWAIINGKSNKIENVLTKIREAENVLSAPEIGEKRYAHLYRYIRLASKRDSMNKALRAFEKEKINGT